MHIHHRDNLAVGKHLWLVVAPVMLAADCNCCWIQLDLELLNIQYHRKIHCSCNYCMVFVVCLSLGCCVMIPGYYRLDRMTEIPVHVEFGLTHSSSRFDCTDIDSTVCYYLPYHDSADDTLSRSSLDDNYLGNSRSSE